MKFAYASVQEPEMSAQGVGQVPVMEEEEFGCWVDLIRERTGTILPHERKSFLVTNLDTRMKEIGCSTYKEYFALINSGMRSLKEWSVFVDRITVHETRFFRHPASLALVRDLVMHKLEDPKSGKISIQVWSAGCATGEEAYTLAMVVNEALSERDETGYFGVTATDISAAALKTAHAGIYGTGRIQGMNAGYVDNYFKVEADGKYRVSEALRKRVCFTRMNIFDVGPGRLDKMDLIYCRNMLIYFDRDVRKKLVDSMVEFLLPGGLLVLGAGELLGWEHPYMEKIKCEHTLAYRRVR